jgi:hypothetical protein
VTSIFEKTDFQNSNSIETKKNMTLYFARPTPNGLRYPLVGGTRERHFVGTNSKAHKVPENAATPTSRVHAVLGGVLNRAWNQK